MVPDVAVFFPVVDYAQTHSPIGALVTCLPIGVAIYFLFDLVMRRPMVALLPVWFQKRIDSGSRLPTSQKGIPHLFFYAGLAAAVLIGAYSHQVWDAFTHKGRWGTRVVPALNETVVMAGQEIPRYKLFQHGSSIIGLPLLGCIALIGLCRTSPVHSVTVVSTRLRVLVLILLCLIPMVVAVIALSQQPNIFQSFGVFIKRSGAILLLLTVGYCFVAEALIAKPKRDQSV